MRGEGSSDEGGAVEKVMISQILYFEVRTNSFCWWIGFEVQDRDRNPGWLQNFETEQLEHGVNIKWMKENVPFYLTCWY